MITGFNTDIQYNGVTYHIQTEDKGLETPQILSLVYDGGTVLASKRSSYDDLLGGDFDETELASRLQKQHKLICAAVRAGRIEDLKRMSAKQKRVQDGPFVPADQPNNGSDQPELQPDVLVDIRIPKPNFALDHSSRVSNPAQEEMFLSLPEIVETPLERSIPKPSEDLIWEIPDTNGEDFSARAERTIEPAPELRAIPNHDIDTLPGRRPGTSIGDFVFIEPEPDELVPPEDTSAEPAAFESSTTAPIGQETEEDGLKINLRKNVAFCAGEKMKLEIFVNQGPHSKGLDGAHIMVKILGSSFRPQIFHGKTDANGIAVIDLKVPNFKKGRAAVLIRAMCDGREGELRRAVEQDWSA